MLGHGYNFIILIDRYLAAAIFVVRTSKIEMVKKLPKKQDNLPEARMSASILLVEVVQEAILDDTLRALLSGVVSDRFT